MTDTHKKFSQDEDLSDFTDRILNGQMKSAASNSDEELRGLEETILRLHSNMPSSPSLEESTKKQMLVRLNARIRREKEQPQKRSFWASLFNPQMRPQFALAMGVITLVIVAVILSPGLGNAGSSTTVGTALNSNSNILIIIGLVAVIVGVLWSTRRK